MIGLGRFVLVVFVLTPCIAVGAEWRMRPAESSITITATQQGAAFTAVFSKFDCQIRFDPADLAQASVVTSVDVVSWDSKSKDRDPYALGPDFFDVAKFPLARFATRSFKDLGGGKYEAAADLTIRGVTRQVVLPFTLTIDGAVARMQGSLTVNRNDFGIGQGDWAKSDWVGQPVKIDIKLVADEAA
jgi:polyisoprenoid-binding protein YceI